MYNNFISLGYFCSVALDLERIGLRSTSSPFDWNISNFEGVIHLIENHFSDFLEYDNLYQNKENKEQYIDIKYNVQFIHDFSKYKSLVEQLSNVKEKYNRRIERFYKNITEPTLFIRYISDEKRNDEGKSCELIYIENNYNHIVSLLKSFNSHNSIIFIANKEVKSDLLNIYHVEKDENDNVARKPIDKNKELYNFLNKFDIENKKQNIKKYKRKEKKKKSIVKKLYKKIKLKIEKMTKTEYIHEKTK